MHTIAIAYCTYDISDVLAEGVNLRNTFLHLTLFSLMKLFLMSFSYIGNAVSAQLIHKETLPALIGFTNILRGGGVWQFYGLCVRLF